VTLLTKRSFCQALAIELQQNKAILGISFPSIPPAGQTISPKQRRRTNKAEQSRSGSRPVLCCRHFQSHISHHLLQPLLTSASLWVSLIAVTPGAPSLQDEKESPSGSASGFWTLVLSSPRGGQVAH
jgi:hypothetical protein